jgi:hypothetical protein
MTKNPIGQATLEQINDWKARHKTVVEVTVVDDAGTQHVGYLKKPDRTAFSQALSEYSRNRMVEAGEVVLANCWLGGSDAMRDDDPCNDIYTAAALESYNAIRLLQSTSKKL